MIHTTQWEGKFDCTAMISCLISFSFSFSHSFRCGKCEEQSETSDEAAWSSGYCTVLVRGCFRRSVDEDGNRWLIGVLQLNIFTQACIQENHLNICDLRETKIPWLVEWLHRWLANNFHGFNLRGRPFTGPKPKTEHLTDYCSACRAGCCSFGRRA